MRRMLATSFSLAAAVCAFTAVPQAAGAKTPLTLTKVHADWFGSSHRIFVDATWTPKRFETQVVVKISVNGDSLRTLRVTNWIIGRKVFKLTVPASVAKGSTARIEVRVHSEAGDDKRAVSLDLP
ncbi:MAG TPA: hypothetical protein VFD90_12935 [Gaiellales bacterium]|jgi:hypothetical protein|nr:hypothetical protein [Gaiellales bacterium]